MMGNALPSAARPQLYPFGFSRNRKWAAMRCSAGLGNRCWHYSPREHLLEILEAILTDPSVLVERAVPVMENIGIVFDHELRPAKLAMVMIPVRIFRVTPICASAQLRPG